MTQRRNLYILWTTVAGCFALSSIVAKAQDMSAQKMDQGSSKMLKSADTAFAIKAAQGGVAEVEMGKLAVEKGSSADVKAFGQQMVDDHTKANDDLKSVAEKKGMTLPDDMNAHQHATYRKLRTTFRRRLRSSLRKGHGEGP